MNKHKRYPPEIRERAVQQTIALVVPIVISLVMPSALAAGPYASLAVGAADEKARAGVYGVNHPTRCDRLLYANPASAPTDAACTDNTPQYLIDDSFSLGVGFVGTASLGYAWDNLRAEVEFLGRSHSGDTVPGLPGDNTALLTKQSEWSPQSPPHYRLSEFSANQLFVNVHYVFDLDSQWSPFVGAGLGFAQVKARLMGSYLRRTLAEGYVEGAGGDPAQPAEWQLAAAGTESRVDTRLKDEVFGYQVLGGLERMLGERTSAFVMARWTDFDEIAKDQVWTVIRSHAPVQADGATPFQTEQTIDDLGGWAVTAGLRYAF